MRSPALSLLVLSLLVAGGEVARAGETACWFENGAVVAPAAIGGVSGDFVIDLSAPHTLLHETAAQTAGLTDTALSLPVRVAGQKTEATAVSVRDLDYRGVGFSTPINGVIGADVLDRYVLILDFAPCRLQLRPRNSPPRRSGRALAVTMVGGTPTVSAAASDGLRGVSGPFALDTASAGGVRARGAADAPRQKPAGTLRGLSLDGELRQDVSAVVAGDLPDGVVGAIGASVLSAYRLTLDPAALRLWLSPSVVAPGHSK
ncbi:hypothetical protein BH10PSE4_BH10PSE4_14230 [soil metagenome]